MPVLCLKTINLVRHECRKVGFRRSGRLLWKVRLLRELCPRDQRLHTIPILVFEMPEDRSGSIEVCLRGERRWLETNRGSFERADHRSDDTWARSAKSTHGN